MDHIKFHEERDRDSRPHIGASYGALRKMLRAEAMTLAIVNKGVWKTRGIASFFPEGIAFKPRRGAAGVLGWGEKPSAQAAKKWAAQQGIPYIAVEDGFLRSVGLGVNGAPPLSLVLDDVGIYYDANMPSRLERLIAGADASADLLANARACMALLRQYRLSKYNHAPARLFNHAEGGSRILVVDQTAGDISVTRGGADAGVFRHMLDAALNDYPEGEIWVKTHPDVCSGKKQGYFDVHTIQGNRRVRIFAEDCCPLTLIDQFDHIYVVTSQMGFEALMLGKPVTCFGRPWYAGWGLTDDRHPGMAELRERRAAPRSLEQLFAAAYLQYARYIDPASGRPGTLFDVIDWLARNKAINDDTRGTLYCVGMSVWKRAVVRPFLQTPSSRLRFVRRLDIAALDAMPADARVVLWGNRDAALAAAARARRIPVLRIEDGFVRSVGLGSDLHVPLSLAVDGPGIYYDPYSGSRLERMLQDARLSANELARATTLRATLVSQKISKYNVGTAFALAPQAAGKRVILVPGQVEDDASICTGSPAVNRNADLLARVRNANPGAWIVYKPHPDVVAGNRQGSVSAEALARLADQVAREANVTDCIAAANEVHTMTSLAGFEALLMGKVVHCHGGPFYAGWGLTVDHLPLPHRRRRLSVDELVFVVLCRYPRYRLPGVDGFCAVEDVMRHLAAARQANAPSIGSHWLGRQWRKARQLAKVLHWPRWATLPR